MKLKATTRLMAAVTILAATFASACAVMAQDGGPSPSGDSKSDHPVQIDPALNSTLADLPPDVKVIVDQFRAARDAYIADQKTSASPCRTATAEARTVIRAELRANVRDYANGSGALREQVRDRVAELRTQMMAHAKAVAAGSPGGSRPGAR